MFSLCDQEGYLHMLLLYCLPRSHSRRCLRRSRRRRRHQDYKQRIATSSHPSRRFSLVPFYCCCSKRLRLCHSHSPRPASGYRRAPEGKSKSLPLIYGLVLRPRWTWLTRGPHRWQTRWQTLVLQRSFGVGDCAEAEVCGGGRVWVSNRGWASSGIYWNRTKCGKKVQ